MASQGMQRLGGRVAVVTGGASGIGRATALLLAEQGARVWGHRRRQIARRPTFPLAASYERLCHHQRRTVGVSRR